MNYSVIYNGKSDQPWEIWFLASSGARLFLWSTHEHEVLALRLCARLNALSAQPTAMAA